MRYSKCLVKGEQMISLKQVHTEDFDRIYPLLKKLDNSHERGKQDWQIIFKDIWNTDTGYIGYMLLDDNVVVGFFGLLFSNPRINDQHHKMCNFCNCNFSFSATSKALKSSSSFSGKSNLDFK